MFSEVIILAASGENVRDILLDAYDLGMNTGDYAFVAIELIKNKRAGGDYSWYKLGDRRNKQAREMFESLLMVAVRVPVSNEYNTFVHEVAKKATAEFGVGSSEGDVSLSSDLVLNSEYECEGINELLNHNLRLTSNNCISYLFSLTRSFTNPKTNRHPNPINPNLIMD